MKGNIKSFAIRAWGKSDINSLTKYLNNKKIWDNCRDSLPFPYTLTDAEQFIQLISTQKQQNHYCIDIANEAVGNISFERGKDVERFNAEVGYWLAEPYWNQGIMCEALGCVINKYLTSTDVIRLFANVYESNVASMRVLEKVGFRKAGIHKNACFKNGHFTNVHYFELLKDEIL